MHLHRNYIEIVNDGRARPLSPPSRPPSSSSLAFGHGNSLCSSSLVGPSPPRPLHHNYTWIVRTLPYRIVSQVGQDELLTVFVRTIAGIQGAIACGAVFCMHRRRYCYHSAVVTSYSYHYVYLSRISVSDCTSNDVIGGGTEFAEEALVLLRIGLPDQNRRLWYDSDQLQDILKIGGLPSLPDKFIHAALRTNRNNIHGIHENRWVVRMTFWL